MVVISRLAEHSSLFGTNLTVVLRICQVLELRP